MTILIPPYKTTLLRVGLIVFFSSTLFPKCESTTPIKSPDKTLITLDLSIARKNYTATVDEAAKAFTITNIPFDTDLSTVTVATIAFSPKATASVKAGDKLIFTSRNTATITVTAENGTKQDYTVIIKMNPPSAEGKLSALTLTISGKDYSVTAFADHSATIVLPSDVAIPSSAVVKAIMISNFATSTPKLNEVVEINNNNVAILVTAQNGDPHNYTILLIH